MSSIVSSIKRSMAANGIKIGCEPNISVKTEISPVKVGSALIPNSLRCRMILVNCGLIRLKQVTKIKRRKNIMDEKDNVVNKVEVPKKQTKKGVLLMR